MMEAVEIFSDPKWWPTALVVLAAAIFLITASLTRLSTSRFTSKVAQKYAGVPTVPYWIPFVGHAFRILGGLGDLLLDGFKASTTGVFSLRVLGGNYNIITSSDLAQQELQRRKYLSPHALEATALAEVGGLSQQSIAQLSEAFDSEAERTTMTGSADEAFVMVSLERLQENIVNLVSGCASPIDQMPWEKAADANLTSSMTECNLFALIQSFNIHIILQAFMPATPPDIISSLAKGLVELNATALPLYWNIPQWLGFLLPLPGLHAAYRAKRQVINTLYGYHEALDRVDAGQNPGSQWIELESYDVGHSRFGARREVMKHYNVSSEDRAKADTVCLWHLTQDAGSHVFWSLLSAFTSSNELESVREQAEKLVRVEEQAALISGSSIREPPKVTFDEKMLQGDDGVSPLSDMLFHAFTQRYRGVTLRQTNEDEVLKVENSTEMTIRGHDYVGIAYELIVPSSSAHRNVFKSGVSTHGENLRPKLSDEALVNVLKSDPALQSFNTLRPLITAALASILEMWDITPVLGNRGWDGRIAAEGSWDSFISPSTKRTAGFDLPQSDVRVQIKRRP